MNLPFGQGQTSNKCPYHWQGCIRKGGNGNNEDRNNLSMRLSQSGGGSRSGGYRVRGFLPRRRHVRDSKRPSWLTASRGLKCNTRTQNRTQTFKGLTLVFGKQDNHWCFSFTAQSTEGTKSVSFIGNVPWRKSMKTSETDQSCRLEFAASSDVLGHAVKPRAHPVVPLKGCFMPSLTWSWSTFHISCIPDAGSRVQICWGGVIGFGPHENCVWSSLLLFTFNVCVCVCVFFLFCFFWWPHQSISPYPGAGGCVGVMPCFMKGFAPW